MTDMFPCGDHEALVAYLYDECEPADRDKVAAHVSHCVSCAEEIASLRATRIQLAAWAPPDARLGFQITQTDAANEPLAFAPRARSAGPWWREPLPAWAQVAAAVLIFAAGMTAGTLRTDPANETVATAPTAAPAPAAVSTPVIARSSQPAPAAPGVSAADLARVEQRLRAIESMGTVNASTRTVSAASLAPVAGEPLTLAQARVLIAESEERQRRENVTLVAGVARDFETLRRADLSRVGEKFGEIETLTGQDLRTREGLTRVGFQPPPRTGR